MTANTKAFLSTILAAVAIWLLGVSTSLSDASAFTNADDCFKIPGQQIEWPLPPLTTEERQTRINLFVKQKEFVLSEEQQHSRDECAEILHALKTDRAEILAPEFFADTLSDPRALQILSTCGNLRSSLDKRYYSRANGELFSPQFWAKTDSEKLEQTSWYTQATANAEFYDLSQFLGRGTWGYFAEGAVPHCRDAGLEQCSKLAGYGCFDSGMGRVFNVSSCEVYLDTWLRTNRLTANSPAWRAGRTTGVAKALRYKEKPDFFAFIAVDGHLYRLGLWSSFSWSRFADVNRPASIGLVIDNVEARPASLATRKYHCSFKSK